MFTQGSKRYKTEKKLNGNTEREKKETERKKKYRLQKLLDVGSTFSTKKFKHTRKEIEKIEQRKMKERRDKEERIIRKERTKNIIECSRCRVHFFK